MSGLWRLRPCLSFEGNRNIKGLTQKMGGMMKISVCDKDGSGKSTVVALLANEALLEEEKVIPGRVVEVDFAASRILVDEHNESGSFL